MKSVGICRLFALDTINKITVNFFIILVPNDMLRPATKYLFINL